MDRLQSEPFARRGYNADRNEDGSPCIPSGHDCLDFLESHSATSAEPHGEVFTDEWYVCTECGERYSEDQVEEMYHPTVAPPAAGCRGKAA